MKKKQLLWSDFPRTKDKIAIVGFAKSTRDLAPWKDETFEIISLNEGYKFPWMKRFDRWMQIHPHWDFSKENNLNDPNHFLWLQNKEGQCVSCAGRGYILTKDMNQITCEADGCKDGVFHPPEYRKDLIVYTQKYYDDVHNSIPLPLDEIHDKFFRKYLGDRKYFTSSAAYLLGLAMLYGYKQIDFYGFEMGTTSEYHYQRANFEYMVGVAHGLGFDVNIPVQSPILQGELYAFENMQQGYRQNLEMRKVFLKTREEIARSEMFKLAGAVETLKRLENESPACKKELMDALGKYHNALAMVNVYSGAIRETENLTSLYDGYFRNGQESTRSDEKLVAEFVNTGYKDAA